MSEKDGLWYTDPSSEAALKRPRGLPETDAKRVVLFGGTFDPPHVGHLAMATLTLEQTDTDEVWFMPAPSPPHKSEIGDDTFLWRISMVDALIGDRSGLRTVPIEKLLPRPSFSVDTVRACKQWYPDIAFHFLIGADSLAQLPTWRGAATLTKLVQFYVAGRSGHPFQETLDRVREQLPDLQAESIEMPLLDVSSTWLRDRLDNHLDVCGLIPSLVLEVWHTGP
ncbi:nicotinate (nicotinamide) nucleotide adenylyltransferase [Alicyclobacillus dauci]|uniref:Probable nicotinate-nucleotide adenylyltransferase n=1 Tax=Alicyclobacillus dauci TaxID=1475485 RepID=A0ABY6Z762_9BACL|nr:nicotinate (nicotinamide) nucleotide adenylyltransferase [Alicyclobacillus dauci]WAH38518.1 nicotinate (nicotinamide) nucleotide adenylyltransferase [Alicyclobacillus dauci]